MPFWAVIPARMKSTRLPNKPLADIGGQPMVVRVAQRARASGAERVVVATDHDQIADAVRAAGFEAVLTPESCTSGTDRLAAVVEHFGLADEHILVNLQGDEPLMDAELVGRVALHLAKWPELALATAAHALESADQVFNPNVVKVALNVRQEALYFSRAPIPWARDAWMDGARDQVPAGLPIYRHIGLYAYRAGFLRRFTAWPVAPIEQFESLEQLRALWQGEKIGVVLSEHVPLPGVDTPDDLERVRELFARSARL